MSTRFHFVSGRLALDFCNTSGEGYEHLHEPGDLHDWLAQAHQAIPETRPGQPDLEEARVWRDRLRPALVAGDTTRVAELVDEWLDPTMVRLCVDRQTLGMRPEPVGRTCHCALVPVALDALAIARDHPDRVRECAADSCPALFLDLSRNRSRRWCSMDVCGAREKARAYYWRSRGNG